jgi:hypothetical protein
MRDNGRKALQKCRYKATDSSYGGLVAANLLDQDFGCGEPDQKGDADIRYLWTAEDWLYLATILGRQDAAATRVLKALLRR